MLSFAESQNIFIILIVFSGNIGLTMLQFKLYLNSVIYSFLPPQLYHIYHNTYMP